MYGHTGVTTNPTLLRRVGDWRDVPAWDEFVERYRPLLRRWCRGYGLDDDSTEEVCQRVWVELAGRMRAFRYDPGQRFRGWLKGLCHFRAMDLIRERKKEGDLVRPLGDDAQPINPPTDEDEDDDQPDDRRLLLRQVAEQAQAAVRGRVDPKAWEIYWRVGIDGHPLDETAAAFGMTRVATYRAQKRVEEKLREEGDRRLAALLHPNP